MLREPGRGGGGAERGRGGIEAAAVGRAGGGGTGSAPRVGCGIVECDCDRAGVGGGGRRPGGGKPPCGNLDDEGIGDGGAGGAGMPRSTEDSTPRPEDGCGVRDVP